MGGETIKVYRGGTSGAGYTDGTLVATDTADGSGNKTVSVDTTGWTAGDRQITVTATASGKSESLHAIPAGANAGVVTVGVPSPIVLDLSNPTIGQSAAWPLTLAQMNAGFSVCIGASIADWTTVPDYSRLLETSPWDNASGEPGLKVQVDSSATGVQVETNNAGGGWFPEFTFSALSSGAHEFVITVAFTGADPHFTLHLDGTQYTTGNYQLGGFGAAPATLYVGRSNISTGAFPGTISNLRVSTSTDWTTARYN